MRRSLVPLFLLVSLGSADAQNFVSGVIRDEFGGSVSGARVRLESISGAFNQAIVTGEDGRFRFETGRTGRALLTIESPDSNGTLKKSLQNNARTKISISFCPSARFHSRSL